MNKLEKTYNLVKKHNGETTDVLNLLCKGYNIKPFLNKLAKKGIIVGELVKRLNNETLVYRWFIK